MLFRPNGPEHEAHLCPPASRPLQLASCSLAADVGCHAPPRGVRMPRSFNSAAIARTLVMPWDRRSIHDGPLGSPHAALCVRLDSCLLLTCLPLSALGQEKLQRRVVVRCWCVWCHFSNEPTCLKMCDAKGDMYTFYLTAISIRAVQQKTASLRARQARIGKAPFRLGAATDVI
jgi:hypothetical protein